MSDEEFIKKIEKQRSKKWAEQWRHSLHTPVSRTKPDGKPIMNDFDMLSDKEKINKLKKYRGYIIEGGVEPEEAIQPLREIFRKHIGESAGSSNICREIRYTLDAIDYAWFKKHSKKKL